MNILYTNEVGDTYSGMVRLFYADGFHADIQVQMDGSSKFFENVPHIPGARGAWDYDENANTDASAAPNQADPPGQN